ncbi:hypothetical protein SI65_01293 [Aspergillus cristatus]|uniref:Coenzyme Q-binding protein COQ10 START domain-containing protein n=1 Tax=Aspergillus cristatus TaxID=573508 RepID=A0A1E3BRV7_ASPCR|nr:hypothetical protein SI65_01293 [Aspergillus cristatus]
MKPSLARPLCHNLISNARLYPSRIAISQLQPQPLHRHQPLQPRTPPPTPQTTPRRTFFSLPDLSSVLPNNNSNGNNNNHTRTLTATRTLPYAPKPLFTVIASVDSYSQFLPFLTASTVTARDPSTNYPTTAFLTVGYGPLSETFTSRVDCDPENLVVEARSGARFGVDKKGGQEGMEFPGAREGIFEYLSTRWELVPLEGGNETRVQLKIEFEFRSQFHAAVMSAVEGQMAGVMIEAFEKRMREVQR